VPSKLLNPFTEDGAAWDAIVFGGVRFEGVVSVTGTPWKKKHDHRRARGRNGARSVATGWDLGEWSVTLTAIDDEDIDALGELIDAVTQRGEGQDANALVLEHPALAVAGVSQVLLEEAEAPEVEGTKVTWKCKVKEYRPPTPRPVTATPAAAEQGIDQPPRFGVTEFEAQSVRRTTPTPPSSDP
jgi:hypothetical protein